MDRAVEAYLTRLGEIRATGAGTAETSYYGDLEGLLNEIGSTLRPPVLCVPQLQDQGAGHPDFGLFTADQLQRGVPRAGQLPERGVIEVKPVADDAWLTAGTEQVSDYWRQYRLVLVTNLRDFLIIGEDGGQSVRLESFRLASGPAAFWEAVATPRRTAREKAAAFREFLVRALSQRATLREPRDVAWFLASYARDALARVEARHEIPALAAVRDSLEEALGIKFEGEKGEHLFRSALVQTLFYGIFSAWVLRSRAGRQDSFDWRTAAWDLRVPMIQVLFEQVVLPSRLGPLELQEVLDWTAATLRRVDRTAFFARFDESRAVQYFYEPFLEAFDPQLRKQLGVWYTPPEVVRYMVARVDRAVREELGVPDGLADERVFVLDPCTGTGSFLVEVLHRIAATLSSRGEEGLLAQRIKHIATHRVFGFELLPAPFVVAHLQIGLLLQSLGAELATGERVGVFLTNALTGWEPPDETRNRTLPLPELQAERDAAGHVKREAPILVVLGNPPYSGFAGMAMGEERILSTAYRTVRRVRRPEGQGLNELYVRFFRMAERRIVEQTGQGVVCFISNYSWLDGLSHTGMRERYLEAFDRVWIDCLNGDKFKTGKVTPEGEPDPSIFSTDTNREGIQVGTAIALLVRRASHEGANEVHFRNLWGRRKRQDLLESAENDGDALYERLVPPLEVGLPFVPVTTGKGFLSWPRLPELFQTFFPGVKTSRDDFVIDVDRDRLIHRMQRYFDPEVAHEEMRRLAPSAMTSTARFKAEPVRTYLVQRGFLPTNVARYCYRPFDLRWIYWEPETKLLDEKRSEYKPHVFDGNVWIEAREKQIKEDFNRGYCTRVLADNFGNGLSSFFPLFLQHLGRHSPNITEPAQRYLSERGIEATDLFFHTLAILNSPAYRSENGGALRQDWPRVNLPATAELVRHSADLGRHVAALLQPETPVEAVTSGRVRPELRVMAIARRDGGGQWRDQDFNITAGWGHSGAGGVVMPGRGRSVTRDYSPEEIEAIRDGGARLQLSESAALQALGHRTIDVYLNEAVLWSNIPERVWEHVISGYQVIKKWLSYRERSLLGRALTLEEVREVTNMVRRIAALLLLTLRLDNNYAGTRDAAVPLPSIDGRRERRCSARGRRP